MLRGVRPLAGIRSMHDLRQSAGLLTATHLLIFFQVFSQDSSITATTFPTRKLFPTFTADALAHQLSVSRVTDNREWIGAVGASIPVVQLQKGDVQLQAGVGATVFNRLIKTPGHVTVSTVDYKIDLPIDVGVGETKLRIGYGHISSHWADDGIEQLGKSSISSVKDYLSLAASRGVPLVQGFVYSVATYLYHNEPQVDKKWQFQIGAEFANVALTDFLQSYCALDIKLKHEVGWGTTQSYQAGIRLFSHAPHALRVCYTLRTGYEERGQLYDQTATAHLITLAVDF
jgi:hypothetical protein